jgi:hypothetical protein
MSCGCDARRAARWGIIGGAVCRIDAAVILHGATRLSV